jgi:hypothetical protein
MQANIAINAIDSERRDIVRNRFIQLLRWLIAT